MAAVSWANAVSWSFVGNSCHLPDSPSFGTLKAWMGATHFKTRTLDKVRTEMSLHVLAYNLKRVMAILGAKPLMATIQA